MTELPRDQSQMETNQKPTPKRRGRPRKKAVAPTKAAAPKAAEKAAETPSMAVQAFELIGIKPDLSHDAEQIIEDDVLTSEQKVFSGEDEEEGEIPSPEGITVSQLPIPM